jgi:hypothetical protein
VIAAIATLVLIVLVIVFLTITWIRAPIQRLMQLLGLTFIALIGATIAPLHLIIREIEIDFGGPIRLLGNLSVTTVDPVVTMVGFLANVILLCACIWKVRT